MLLRTMNILYSVADDHRSQCSRSVSELVGNEVLSLIYCVDVWI